MTAETFTDLIITCEGFLLFVIRSVLSNKNGMLTPWFQRCFVWRQNVECYSEVVL